MLWIRITLMRRFLFDADPDPDPDPSVKKRLETLKKCKNLFDICKLMRIQIRFRIKLINFDADPNECGYGSGFLCDADADPEPQHWSKLY